MDDLFYRRVARDGSIIIVDGKLILKDSQALIRTFLKAMDGNPMPLRSKIVMVTLMVQKRWKLTTEQAFRFWEEMEIAAHEDAQ